MAYKHTQKKVQQQRDDLTGEHTVGDVGQIVLACLFAATWITDTFFFKYTTFLNQYVPLVARIPSGVVLLVLSGYLAKTSLSIVFGEEREKSGVIRKSSFGIVRHPIYLSEILLYLGLLMLSISLAAAVVWVIADSCTTSRDTKKDFSLRALARIMRSTCRKCQCGFLGFGRGEMNKTWVYDPHSGGIKIPQTVRDRTRNRILVYTKKHYSGKYTRIDVRFRGQLCYIDAYIEPYPKTGPSVFAF
jgi:protein-S-isoprenylcysteine O-methyltransferase Ste14